MRLRFEQAWEVIPKEARKGTISYMAMKQIQAIYREEGKLKELHSKERLEQRQAIIKPLVDAFSCTLNKIRQKFLVQESFMTLSHMH